MKKIVNVKNMRIKPWLGTRLLVQTQDALGGIQTIQTRPRRIGVPGAEKLNEMLAAGEEDKALVLIWVNKCLKDYTLKYDDR